MKITEEQYKQAVQKREECDETIHEYHRQRLDAFKERLKSNPIFTDDELFYSRESLCPCGHGLAYPKGCGMNHYWDCSAILKGIADNSVEHTGQLPFAFYDVKGERDGQSTRGVFKPKESHLENR